MDIKLQRNIFMAFFRSGMLGYGGGPSSIPFIHKEVVERYDWMSDEEFSDVLAIGNTLPGPIATKMVGYLGYRVGGVIGSTNAIVATVLPTVVLMILLIGFLSKYQNSPTVQGITQAIIPVIGVMIASLAYSFFKQSQEKLGWKVLIILGVISFIVLELIKLHPAILIIAIMIYSFARKSHKKTKTNSKSDSISG